MIRVNKKPERFFHVFRAFDGSVFEIETNETEYRKLALPNPKNPTDNNGTWVQSYSKTDLDEGEYCEDNGAILLKKDGILMNVPHKFVLNDSLTTDGEAFALKVKNFRNSRMV